MRLNAIRRNDHGFTLTETVIAVTVASIMIIVMFAVTFNYYAFAVQSQEAASLALESQTLLGQAIEDLRLADGVGNTNQLSDDHAPAGGWQTSDQGNVLIVRAPATTTVQDILYHPDTGFPHQNEYIYFLEGTTLYKRILRNPDATGNSAVTTCPKSQSSVSCPEDRVFSINVSDITFTLYDINNSETTDPSLSRSVRLTIDMEKSIFGRSINLSNTMHVTQRNE